jgi:hypothetical protein
MSSLSNLCDLRGSSFLCPLLHVRRACRSSCCSFHPHGLQDRLLPLSKARVSSAGPATSRNPTASGPPPNSVSCFCKQMPLWIRGANCFRPGAVDYLSTTLSLEQQYAKMFFKLGIISIPCRLKNVFGILQYVRFRFSRYTRGSMLMSRVDLSHVDDDTARGRATRMERLLSKVKSKFRTI